jgi:deazaflavin-dependent oxidoreductase (nitroreductase family)
MLSFTRGRSRAGILVAVVARFSGVTRQSELIVVSFESGKPEPRNIYVTTIGRVSGLPREFEIWFVTLRGKYFIMAESPRAHWIRNIECNTHVKVRIEDRQFEAVARVLDEQNDADLFSAVRGLMRIKYRWGDGLPVEITPIGQH